MDTRAATAALCPDALAPGTRLGPWRVVERLGVGGQGAVYRVEDTEHPGDFYALKLALHAGDRRAEREVELMMGRAVHPQVVRFHGCARWPHPREGRLGFVMDWVPGQALDTWAETEGTTFRQLATVGASLARTLGELHARGVLHRDLKPEHIRVRESDGQPLLLDFGAGWFEGAAPLTTGPLPPTTLSVLSPEAVRFLWKSPHPPGAHHVFESTDDLYALGVCLYRAVTGHYPFSEWLSNELLQLAIVHGHPEEPIQVHPRIPRALNDVIVRLLAKDPQKRYSRGEELHEALSEAAKGQEAEWDTSIFAWEDVPSSTGAPGERQPLWPRKPRFTWKERPAPPAARVEPRTSWPRSLLLAAAVLLVLFLGIRESSVEQEQAGWMTDSQLEPTQQQTREPRPARNQKQAPCTAKLEVEVSGACWHSLRQKPPDCPPQTVAYQGECLWPVPQGPHSIPTSVEDGGHIEAR
ncbi:MAG: serine/threonine-protein kinase [Cystobacter sp.]